MAEFVYDGTLLPRNEQQYQAQCLEDVIEEAGSRPRRGHSIKANRMALAFQQTMARDAERRPIFVYNAALRGDHQRDFT
jgi:hypothetical protein